jgi:hypothetical protein
MKARLLKQILNNTGYNVHNKPDMICIGSPLCSDLISVDKKTLNVKYALDTFREGRKCFEETSRKSESTELLFIWDKLHELIENGEINDIINGDDILIIPLPIYTVKDGELIETFTDAYGYPNVTISGELMYENEYFKTKEEALKEGIKEYEYYENNLKEQIIESEKEILKKREKFIELNNYILHLTSILNK